MGDHNNTDIVSSSDTTTNTQTTTDERPPSSEGSILGGKVRELAALLTTFLSIDDLKNMIGIDTFCAHEIIHLPPINRYLKHKASQEFDALTEDETQRLTKEDFIKDAQNSFEKRTGIFWMLTDIYDQIQLNGVIDEINYFLEHQDEIKKLMENDLRRLSEFERALGIFKLASKANDLNSLEVLARALEEKEDSVESLVKQVNHSLLDLQNRPNHHFIQAKCITRIDDEWIQKFYYRHLMDEPRVTHLHLSNTGIKEIPESIARLGNLEFITLWETRIERLPDCLADMGSLREIHISGTNLETIPEVLFACPSLQKLSIRDSRLAMVPDDITCWPDLDRFDVTNNELTNLPIHLSLNSKLVEVYAEQNHLNSQADVSNLKIIEARTHGRFFHCANVLRNQKPLEREPDDAGPSDSEQVTRQFRSMTL